MELLCQGETRAAPKGINLCSILVEGGRVAAQSMKMDVFILGVVVAVLLLLLFCCCCCCCFVAVAVVAPQRNLIQPFST